MEYTRQLIQTDRLNTAYFRAGTENRRKLLLLHGNLSSSVFFQPLFDVLTESYDIAVPDLRGFGDTETLPIDATRGYRDWSDDIFAFVQALGWKSFDVCGWSMGGNIAMQLVIDHPSCIRRLILIAPGSPYGFGGTYDEEGTPFQPIGLGSGGGCANPLLVSMASTGSRLFMRDILKKLYFKPPFRMSYAWENKLIDEIAKTKVGMDNYPGSYQYVPIWPYVAAGDRGVLNAMSPLYANQSELLSVSKKPPILWLHGKDDIIVSDQSMMEFGFLGLLGIVPGYPGEETYPPQPMVKQTRRFFDLYKDKGGAVREQELPGGHMCILEHPDLFYRELNSFLQQ